MKTGFWIVVLFGLAVAIGMVSIAVAVTDTQGNVTGPGDKAPGVNAGDAAPALSPAANKATVKSVQWWKNGVNQGNIQFDASKQGAITVSHLDTVMFKVKATYSGSGTGYLLFREPNEGTNGYQESWLLRPGVTTTGKVVRSFMWTSGVDSALLVEAHTRGSDYIGEGDFHSIIVTVN